MLRQIRMPLSQNQFDALVSWVFNLGSGEAAGFHAQAGHQPRAWRGSTPDAPVGACGRAQARRSGASPRGGGGCALRARGGKGMSDWTTWVGVGVGVGVGRLVMDLACSRSSGALCILLLAFGEACSRGTPRRSTPFG